MGMDKRIDVEIALWGEKPAIQPADTINALRLWGCHQLADDFAKVLLQMPVKPKDKDV